MTETFDHPYPLAMKRFPTLRQSLLSSFDNCGLSAAFDAEYRQGWSTTPQARGQLFHRFAAACLRAMVELKEEQIPVDAALGILRDVLRQDDVDRVCPTCGTDEILPGIREGGTRRCKKGHTFESQFVNLPMASVKALHWTAIKWANDNTFDIQNLVDVETRLKATLHYPNRLIGGSVPRVLTGALDALFVDPADREHAIVPDWKDMWSMPAQHEEGVDDEISFGGYFQQRFYAWLIFSSFKTIERVTLREVYVRYSQVREASITRYSMPEIEAELEALAERFDRAMNDYLSLPELDRRRMQKSGKLPFAPTPGKHCNFCLRSEACPIPGYARDEGKIVDADDAVLVAKKILVAEKVLKDARSALRAYADIHGPVPVKDAKGKRAFGYVLSERTVKPTIEEMERAMLNKGGPLTIAEIRELYKTKTHTTFKAHVPEDVDESQIEAEIQAQLEESIAAAQLVPAVAESWADIQKLGEQHESSDEQPKLA